MIRSLSIQNFKSWRRLDELQLAPITVLFGANSSGKTSILQLLLLLKQTAQSSDRSLALDFGGENSLVNLGTLSDVLHRHDSEASLGWRVSWDAASPIVVGDASRASSRKIQSDHVELSSEVRLGSADLPVMTKLAYSLPTVEFSLDEGGDEGFVLSVRPQSRFTLKRGRGRPWPFPSPQLGYRFPDQVKSAFANADFLSDFELSFVQLMNRLQYLGPVREDPSRQYVWGGAQPQGVGQWGERTVDALLTMRARGEKVRTSPRRSVGFESYIARMLAKLGLIETFSVDEIKKGTNLYQVRVKTVGGGAEVLLTDVGFGLSQILPVVVLAYAAGAGATVLLEQPEIHLHPAVQAGLADVLIDACRRRDTQFIVESHSEHLLQRLQRRVAEETISSADVSLYFCRMEGGESRLEPLAMNELGYITNWPPGFFGDGLGEAVAMGKAAQARAAQQSA